jgi:hypothetical protein
MLHHLSVDFIWHVTDINLDLGAANIPKRDQAGRNCEASGQLDQEPAFIVETSDGSWSHSIVCEYRIQCISLDNEGASTTAAASGRRRART